MRKCNNCGTNNDDTSRYCRSCGKLLNDTSHTSSSDDKNLNWLWCTLCWIGLVADVVCFFSGLIPHAVAMGVLLGCCYGIKNYS